MCWTKCIENNFRGAIRISYRDFFLILVNVLKNFIKST
jgi:hypothetical protein